MRGGYSTRICQLFKTGFTAGGSDNLWRRVGPLVGGAQGRDRSCRRALAGPLCLSRPALDSGVSRARVVGSGGSRCRAPVCLIRQAIAMVRIRSITARSARALAVSRLRGNRDLHFLWGAPHNTSWSRIGGSWPESARRARFGARRSARESRLIAEGVDRRRFGNTARRASKPVHDFSAVVALGKQGVMGTAREADVLGAVVAAPPEGLDVVKLELLGFRCNACPQDRYRYTVRDRARKRRVGPEPEYCGKKETCPSLPGSFWGTW